MKYMVPNLSYSGQTRHIRGRMQGKGGSVLLTTGGVGSGSSYDSIDDYVATTGLPVSGRGASLNKKLETLSLSMKPPKSKVRNIKFNL